MNIIDSERFLHDLGYDYIKEVEPSLEPPITHIAFKDVVPEFKEHGIWLADKPLYEHQYKALESLMRGENLVLISGTGSGKTEAWFLYFYKRFKEGKFKTIAVYPTLALANDQINRISIYCKAIGAKAVQLDAVNRDEMTKRFGVQGVRKAVGEADIVITNPAFLFHELKKYLVRPQSSLLYSLFKKVNMIIFDELDFYTPRGIALLLALIEILAETSDEKPQIVVLTATLANPDEMCTYLREKTGRVCSIVEGKPFRVENRLYIILGKDLYSAWNKLREVKNIITKKEVPEDIVRALEDFDFFKKNAYKVLQFLEALGIQTPSISLNIYEILSKYSTDHGVTLVFAKSIARAEEIAKTLRESIGDKVAAHHHLISKDLRKTIEDKARRGEIKIVVSPRTLMQGIDIGTIVRVVHIGLPENVREYLQREGRKGRRREIPFTETIVIPSSRWDWELLSKGFQAFEKWLSLPLEKTVINPRNKYIALFKGIAKILSPWYKSELTKEEYETLASIGVIRKDNSVSIRRAQWIWERINFYEFGPPYGIKRYLEHGEGSIRPLEPIGHCDLVERFQIGCLDPSEDAMVIRIDSGKSSRIVRSVVEKPLSKINIFSHDALAEAFEEYKYIKMRWGEEASFLRDIARGKLHSYVLAIVYTPRSGFGELKKIPNRVLWHLISSKPRIARAGDRYFVTYDRKVIYVPVSTFGEYRDFTYGMLFDVDDREDSTLLRMGLAFLMIVLRKVFGIPFETIMYSVEKIGEKKFFSLHEPEAAGLLENIDWIGVRKALEGYKPDDLDIVLLSQLDEIAYSDLINLGIDFTVLRDVAMRIVDYITLKNKMRAMFGGRRIIVSKPSKALRYISLEALSLVLEEEPLPKVLTGLAYFDGEEENVAADIYIKYPFTPPPKSLREFEERIEEAIYYSDFKLIVYDKETLSNELKMANLKRLATIVKENAIEVRQEITKLGIDAPSLLTIAESLSIEDPAFQDSTSKFLEAYKTLHEGKDENLLGISMDKLKDFVMARAKIVYLTHLVISSINPPPL
ncbi:MAG: DEAD/DEAH box helicase [Ignisphaera sp.]